MIPRRLRLVWPFAVAVIAFAGAAGLAWASWSFLRTTESASGQVVEIRSEITKFRRDNHSSIVFAPTFVFRDRFGVAHRVESKFYAAPAQYVAGENVRVLYRVEAPSEAVIDDFMMHWGNPLALVAVALVATGVGIGRLRRGRIAC